MNMSYVIAAKVQIQFLTRRIVSSFSDVSRYYNLCPKYANMIYVIYMPKYANAFGKHRYDAWF